MAHGHCSAELDELVTQSHTEINTKSIYKINDDENTHKSRLKSTHSNMIHSWEGMNCMRHLLAFPTVQGRPKMSRPLWISSAPRLLPFYWSYWSSAATSSRDPTRNSTLSPQLVLFNEMISTWLSDCHTILSTFLTSQFSIFKTAIHKSAGFHVR